VRGFAAACGWVGAAASRSVLIAYLKTTDVRLSRLQVAKSLFGRRAAKPPADNTSEQAKGKFFRRQKFALLHNKTASIHRISVAERYLKIIILVVKYNQKYP